MKIALIGTGYVGSQILEEALRRGHQVTVIARQPEKFGAKPGLFAKKGDAYNEDDVARLIEGQDAVINAFSPGAKNPQIEELFVREARVVLAALKRARVKRYVVVGGAGSLEVSPGVQLVETPGFPPEVKPLALATRAATEIVMKDDELDWTVFCPAALLVPGARTVKFRVGEDRLILNDQGESKISVQDYAVALLDELEKPQHIRKKMTAAY